MEPLKSHFQHYWPTTLGMTTSPLWVTFCVLIHLSIGGITYLHSMILIQHAKHASYLHSMILIQHAKHASFQRWYQIPPFDDLIQRAKHERQFAKSRRVLESLLFLLTKKTSDPGYLQYK
jgi:hypothetical protein